MSDDMRVNGAGGGNYVIPDKIEPTPTDAAQGVRGTIACDGKGHLVAKNFAKPIDRYCVGVHENDVHKSDWLARYGPSLCAGVPENRLPTGGSNYKEFLRDSECRAHAAGRQCSETKLQETEARLRAAEEKLKNATGKNDIAAAQREVEAAKKDRDAYLRAIDNDVANMWLKYRCDER